MTSSIYNARIILDRKGERKMTSKLAELSYHIIEMLDGERQHVLVIIPYEIAERIKIVLLEYIK